MKRPSSASVMRALSWALGWLGAANAMGCKECVTTLNERTATRELAFASSKAALPVRVQFEGDFAVLAVSGSVDVIGPDGRVLPTAPFVSVFPGSGGSASAGTAPGGAPSDAPATGGWRPSDADRDQLPYESCKYHAHHRYESMGHSETVVCLTGSRDQSLIVVREPFGPAAVTVTAKVLSFVTNCGEPADMAMGVQVEAVE